MLFLYKAKAQNNVVRNTYFFLTQMKEYNGYIYTAINFYGTHLIKHLSSIKLHDNFNP